MNNKGFDIVILDKYKKLRAVSFFKKEVKSSLNCNQMCISILLFKGFPLFGSDFFFFQKDPSILKFSKNKT